MVLFQLHGFVDPNDTGVKLIIWNDMFVIYSNGLRDIP
jgi:hypothetical protein